MKSTLLLLPILLSATITGFAQRDQLLAAQRAVNAGNLAEAFKQLQQAEATITGAPDTIKAFYYYVTFNAFYRRGKDNEAPVASFVSAGKAMQQGLAIENQSGRKKYTADMLNELPGFLFRFKEVAVKEMQSNTPASLKMGASLFQFIYELNRSDLENLYYAATAYIKAGNYDSALKALLSLKDQQYSGEAMEYYAYSEIAEKEEYFGDTPEGKKNRDNSVRLKLSKNPRDVKRPSKKPEVAQFIVNIYVLQEKWEAAKTAIAYAKQLLPDDNDILLTESAMYMAMGDMEGARKPLLRLAEKNINSADVYFRLGVITASTDARAAELYYLRSLAINPDYRSANVSLGLLLIRDEPMIVDEMNKLGSSEAENKQYDLLNAKRKEMFRASLPFLEKAYALEADPDLGEMILNYYVALEMKDKENAWRAKLGK